MPELVDGITVYRETPDIMASFVEPFAKLGVRLLGACCGSTPEHIRAMAEKLADLPPSLFQENRVLEAKRQFPTRLASRTKSVSLGMGELPRLIGERINPTARKVISQAFRDGKWDLILQEGYDQAEKGANILDLNVGVPGLDEGELLVNGIRQIQMSLDIPLVLDCTNPEALEKGLREYQGKALINSVNGEEKSLKAILPLAKQYGAAVLGLTLDENGIPERTEDRLKIAEKIVNRALEAGLAKEDVFIDCLALTAATNPALTMETIRAIGLVKKHLGVSCILGLSNVSHGLPQRSWLNNTFLALAVGAGLDAAIANPHDERIGETLAAGALLTGRDPGANNYLRAAGKAPVLTTLSNTISPATGDPAQGGSVSPASLHDYIIQGQKEPLISLLDKLLENEAPLKIINEGIVPPLEKIGDLFAKGDVFLPQLMLAGDAVKTAFTYLKEHFPASDISSKETIILGTVKGDIHDIGKNIVKALLESHGYKVIDLGKNVPAQDFISCAKKENARIIGLSALMTTTMVEMNGIIKEIREENLPVKIMVGGAVVTEDYAQKIGADGYGKDAVEAVRLVRSLLNP
jgi:5-methyltetrahydrofolate--homocysteine methyltransferase